jgi:hypothetical protein
MVIRAPFENFRTSDKHRLKPGEHLFSLRNPFSPVLEEAYNARRSADVAEW